MWGGGEWTSGSVGTAINAKEEETVEGGEAEEEEEEVIVLKPDEAKMQLLQSGISRSVSSVATRRRPLLVLDLNGLLVDRIYMRGKERQQFLQKINDQKLIKPQRSGDFLVFTRPGCKDFLRFVLRDFDVAIWSSARKRNIHPVLKLLFTPSSRRQLQAIYGQEECVIKDNPNSDHKPLFIKDLRSLWQRCGSAEYTILVDDSPEKAQYNPPFTSIHPPGWGHVDVNDGELLKGGKLREFLKIVARASRDDPQFTVPAFLEQNPFAAYSPKAFK